MSRLLQQNLIDKKIIQDQTSRVFIPLWEKLEPVIQEERKLLKYPDLWDDCEYLYKELVKLQNTQK